MSDSSDVSADPEPKSPALASALESKPPFSATDEVAELSDLESDWGSEPTSSPRLPVAEPDSPALVSDGKSLLEFLSSSSTSGPSLGSVSAAGSDEVTRLPGPDRLLSNEKHGLPEEWNTETPWYSLDEVLPSNSGSEATASPHRPARESARHTRTRDEAMRQRDEGEAREQDKTRAPNKAREQNQDADRELESDEGQELDPDEGQELEEAASGASSAPSDFYTLLLERLAHMEQRTAAVEAQAELGLYLAEVELAAAVAALQDALADAQAQLKLALDVRGCDVRPRLPPNPSSWSKTSGGLEVDVMRGLDVVCLVVAVVFALAVVLIWVLYPLF